MAKPPPPPLATSWEDEAASVTPLGAKKPQAKPKPPMPPYTGSSTVPPAYPLQPTFAPHLHPPFPVLTNTVECISGHIPTFEKPLFKQLASGQLRPTAVLDLHGLGEGDAWLELVDFLHQIVVSDHRIALVIHGKGHGYGPQRNMGVIKFQIGSWLAGHPKVLAFHTAVPADGGTGALYVYLRRYHRG